MDLTPDLGQMLICSGGLPGSGKTTLNRALSTRLVGSEMVISEELRRTHALDDPFSADHRRRLHPLLAADVEAAVRRSDVVIVDSNLLERRARAVVGGAAGSGRLRVFIAPHAPLDTVIDRVSGKFGKGYLYPPGAYEPVEIIDHGIYSGEPVDVEEAMDAFDIVVQVNTADHRVNWWAKDGSKAEAGRAFAGLIADVSAEIGGGRAPSPTALSLGSHDELWIWDPESMGLVVALPVRTVSFHVRDSNRGRRDRPLVDGSALASFSSSYLGQLRARVGRAQVIVPSCRVAVFDSLGRVLLVQRRDDRRWALPGGSQELDESISDAAHRELREETGVQVGSLELVAVYSGRSSTHVDAFGNVTQGLVFAFAARGVDTRPLRQTDETVEAGYFALTALPPLSAGHMRAVEDAASRSEPLVE